MPASSEPTRPLPPRRARLEPEARPGGGVRWMARLDPAEAAAYDRGVAALVPGIERSLGPEVMANRVRGRGSRPATDLEPWRTARAAWRGAVGGVLASERRVIVADVAECYASIRTREVAKALRISGLGAGDIRVVTRLLDAFQDEGIPGLPIGPAASAVVANGAFASGASSSARGRVEPP